MSKQQKKSGAGATELEEPTEDSGTAGSHEHEHHHEHEHEHEHGHEHGHHHHDHDHDHGPRIEPISLEIEDLTAEGKAKAEERLKRKINDITYALKNAEVRSKALTVLTFEVGHDEYLREQTQLLEELSKDVVLPGFRKGRAPLKLLQLRMGEEGIRSTITSLATNALRQENSKKSYELISKPRVVDYTAGQGQAPATFVVEVETMPEVDLKEWTGLTVEVEEHPMNEEAVSQRLDNLRRQNAMVETAPASAKLGEEDTVIVKTEVKNEKGEVLGHLSKSSLTVYNVKQDRNLPPEVGEQLIGKKAGDSIEADVPVKVTNRRGEEVEHNDHWRVEIVEIKKTRLPELDDEFAKDLGEHETLDALKKKIREDLAKAETDRQKSEAFGKLLRLLVEKNPVDVPPSLLAHRQYELIMQDQHQLSRMGLRLDQVVTDTDKYLRDQRASAEELVKIQMLTAELAKREGLEVSDEDVDKEIEAVAEQTGRKPLAVRAKLEAQKQLPQFRENLSRKKISDYLLSKNTVNKVAPKPAEEEAEKEEGKAKKPTAKAKKPAAEAEKASAEESAPAEEKKPARKRAPKKGEE